MRWSDCALFCAGMFVPAGVQAQTPEAFRAIEAELVALTSGHNSPAVAVAVAHHGRIVWEAGFGFSDAARTVRATLTRG